MAKMIAEDAESGQVARIRPDMLLISAFFEAGLEVFR